MRVLLIEDEFGVGDVVSAYLARSGRKVDWVRTFARGAGAIGKKAHDILLVDLRLPDGDGLDLVRQARDAGDKRPIIIISAQDQVRDRIKGLNAGADDYIVKPFNLGEVEARIHAVQRRFFGSPNPRISIGQASIDLAAERVSVKEQQIDLSKSEWLLLRRLCGPAGQAVTKEDLMKALPEPAIKDGSNAIEVYISRLRRKLGPGVILNKRNIGYRLAV